MDAIGEDEFTYRKYGHYPDVTFERVDGGGNRNLLGDEG